MEKNYNKKLNHLLIILPFIFFYLSVILMKDINGDPITLALKLLGIGLVISLQLSVHNFI